MAASAASLFNNMRGARKKTKNLNHEDAKITKMGLGARDDS